MDRRNLAINLGINHLILVGSRFTLKEIVHGPVQFTLLTVIDDRLSIKYSDELTYLSSSKLYVFSFSLT